MLKNIKFLGVNLSKDLQALCAKIYKTLLTEINEDLNRGTCYVCVGLNILKFQVSSN